MPVFLLENASKFLLHKSLCTTKIDFHPSRGDQPVNLPINNDRWRNKIKTTSLVKSKNKNRFLQEQPNDRPYDDKVF
jgi:hypothetical protein